MALSMLSILILNGCKKEKVIHLGLNAEIIELDLGNQKIYVKDIDEAGVFQERCYIDCNEAIEKHQILGKKKQGDKFKSWRYIQCAMCMYISYMEIV